MGLASEMAISRVGFECRADCLSGQTQIVLGLTPFRRPEGWGVFACLLRSKHLKTKRFPACLRLADRQIRSHQTHSEYEFSTWASSSNKVLLSPPFTADCAMFYASVI